MRCFLQSTGAGSNTVRMIRQLKQFLLLTGFVAGLVWPLWEISYIPWQIVEWWQQRPAKVEFQPLSFSNGGVSEATTALVVECPEGTYPTSVSADGKFECAKPAGGGASVVRHRMVQPSGCATGDVFLWDNHGNPKVYYCEQQDRWTEVTGNSATATQVSANCLVYEEATNAWKGGDCAAPLTPGAQYHMQWSVGEDDGWPNEKDCPYDKTKQARVCK